jgi:dTDP-4-amino-4,6-dideoxygalactose transaminase
MVSAVTIRRSICASAASVWPKPYYTLVTADLDHAAGYADNAVGQGVAMLTHAPLPTWRNLVSALVIPTLPDIGLSAPWRRSGDTAFWFSRSAWSLVAIAKWRQRLTGQPSITVWLPDFFCNDSLVPLRSMGAQLQFYPLTDQMAPDLDACRTLAGEKRLDLFVLVHFFGQPALAEGATALCRETGAWLIEDAAHVLRPIMGIGEYGDCVLYSPHKHLPIPDGAVLVMRENGPTQLTDQASAMEAFQDVYCSLLSTPGFSHQPAWLWLIKRVLQRLGVRPLRRPVTTFLMNADTTNAGQINPKMSPLSKRLLSGLLDTLDSVACIRRQNRLLWDQVLAKINPTPVEIRPVSGEYTPYLACFAFDDAVLAEELFLRWQHAGLPVTTWPDLPPEVSGQKKQHRNALLLRKTRIYLSVHQSINHRKITDCICNLQYG